MVLTCFVQPDGRIEVQLLVLPYSYFPESVKYQKSKHCKQRRHDVGPISHRMSHLSLCQTVQFAKCFRMRLTSQQLTITYANNSAIGKRCNRPRLR